MVSKNKKTNLGQGITNIVETRSQKAKRLKGTDVQKEGSKVSSQNSSKVVSQNICDESISADVQEQNNAKEKQAMNKPLEEHDSIINDNDTHARSLDQLNENENKDKSKTPDSFTDKNVDFDKATKLFQEVSRTNLDTSWAKALKNIKENKGLMWHIRLGHASKTYLQIASKYIPELKNVKFDDIIQDCDVCYKAKAVKKSCPSVRFINSEPLKLVHTDVMGPISPSSFQHGNRYMVTFTDDATRYVWAYSMPDKTCVHIAVSKLLENIRKLKGQKASIQEFRLDNGTEYLTDNMKEVLKKEKINLSPVPPHSPNLNGVAERLNLSLQRMIRSLIFDSGFPKSY